MDIDLNNEILDQAWEEFLDYCLSVNAEAKAEEDYEGRLAMQEYEDWENREQYGILW
jgi:hypothetical protein